MGSICGCFAGLPRHICAFCAQMCTGFAVCDVCVCLWMFVVLHIQIHLISSYTRWVLNVLKILKI